MGGYIIVYPKKSTFRVVDGSGYFILGPLSSLEDGIVTGFIDYGYWGCISGEARFRLTRGARNEIATLYSNLNLWKEIRLEYEDVEYETYPELVNYWY